MIQEGMLLDGKYQVLDRIGDGGMGVVFRARHIGIGRPVAIKALWPQYASDQEQVQRLRAEALAVGGLCHDNICQATDLGTTPDGAPYLVMELLEGRTLASLLAEEVVLPVERALEIARQTLCALQAAHGAGVVHRDLKPENLFLTRSDGGAGDRVKVLDFGISKMLGNPTPGGQRLTKPGTALGTPWYMAPEQARADQNADHRVDLWAVGVIMYQTLTGRLPFPAPDPSDALLQVISEPVVPPRAYRPDMPPEIEAIILQALERDRTKRFDSAESFLAALEAARNTAPGGVVLGDVTTVKLPSRPSSDPPPATPVLLTSRGPTAVQLAAPRSSTPALRVLVAGLGVAVLVLGVAVLVGGRGKNPGEARREALAAAPPVDAARPGEPPAGPADHGTGHGDQPPARDGRRLASPPEPLPSIPNSGEPHAVPPAGGAPPDPGRGGPDRASPPAGADASRGLPASPSRRGVRAAFERARTRVRSCVGGTIRQAVTVRAVARGSDGRIRQVRIDGVSGRDATDCVARAVSDVRVPRFAGSDTLVPHTYGPDSRGDGNGLGARDGPPMLTGRSGTRILTQYGADP